MNIKIKSHKDLDETDLLALAKLTDNGYDIKFEPVWETVDEICERLKVGRRTLFRSVDRYANGRGPFGYSGISVKRYASGKLKSIASDPNFDAFVIKNKM